MADEPKQQNQADMGISGTSMELKGDAYLYDMDYHRLADYFELDGVSRRNIKVANKLSFLNDWAREQAGKDDNESIAKIISDITKEFGDTSIGETLVNRLYREIRFRELSKNVDRNKDNTTNNN